VEVWPKDACSTPRNALPATVRTAKGSRPPFRSWWGVRRGLEGGEFADRPVLRLQGYVVRFLVLTTGGLERFFAAAGHQLAADDPQLVDRNGRLLRADTQNTAHRDHGLDALLAALVGHGLDFADGLAVRADDLLAFEVGWREFADGTLQRRLCAGHVRCGWRMPRRRRRGLLRGTFGAAGGWLLLVHPGCPAWSRRKRGQGCCYQ
jgi:hypothetical protein